MRLGAISLLTLVCIAFAGASAQGQFSFATIDDPLGVQGTEAIGISGNNIVGFYNTADLTDEGFIYNGSTYTTISDPLATRGTSAYGVSGNNVVGFYSTGTGYNSFLYNGSAYTTISDPLATNGTFAYGISGNNIVGEYDNATGQHGFLYNVSTSTYTALDDPAGVAGTTYAEGVDGNLIVGTYVANGISHGFLFNGTTYTTVNDPLATTNPSLGTSYGTTVSGISGNNIVGYYTDTSGKMIHGFLYNGTTYTNVDDPAEYPYGINGVAGIDGNNVVGVYQTTDGLFHGFEATSVPEPSSIGLSCLALAVLAVRLVRKRNEAS